MFFHMAEYCDTLQSKEKRNREYKACLNERAILHLLDHNVTWKLGCFPAPERDGFSKNSGIFLQLNAKLSITYQYLKHHHISDRMMCPYKDSLTFTGIFMIGPPAPCMFVTMSLGPEIANFCS